MKIYDIEQGTPEWFQARAGIISASMADKLVTSTGAASKQMADYASQLAGELFAGMPLDTWKGNQWTERGHELEPQARGAYQIVTDYEVTQAGFITDDANVYGASPDGMIYDKEGGLAGLLEIKCLSAKKHVQALDYYDAKGKAPPTYIPQTQFQILVTGARWNDLMYYHPYLPSLVIRQHHIEKVTSTLKAQIIACQVERDRLVNILRKM